MIAVIIDIVSSRRVAAQKRRSLDKKLRKLLLEIHERFSEYCLAAPSLTQGDSIELLVDNWVPIIFAFHKLLSENIEIRVGFGTGKIIVHSKDVDECDGPIFWNARQALDKIKQAKYKRSSASFIFAKQTANEDESDIFKSILFLTTLLNLSSKQLQHCFHLIWEQKNVTEIAKIAKTTIGNISKRVNKTPCYLLAEIVSFQTNA
ncbi:MAG: SatD family protein [Candidatus Thorarchaeota archaeon]